MLDKRKTDDWVRCPKCGHKLFRKIGNKSDSEIKIEIKCHSCKEITEIALG